MKIRSSLVMALVVALLVSGCTAKLPPTTVSGAGEATSVAATTVPSQQLLLERAAKALDGLIPQGMTLDQQIEADHITRRLLPAQGKGALLLPDLPLGGAGWDSLLAPAALDDQDFMADVLLLVKAGFTADASKYDQPALRGDAIDGLLAVVASTGYTADSSAIDPAVTQPNLRQALELDLEEYSDTIDGFAESSLAMELSLYQLQLYMVRAVKALECRVLARAGRQTTLEDAVRLWPLVTPEEKAPFTASNGPMTRLDLARAFWSAYSIRYLPDPVPEESSQYFSHTDVYEYLKAEVQEFSYYQIMGDYPTYSLFSPELPVRMEQLPQWISDFYAAYRDGQDTDDTPSATGEDTIYTAQVTYPQLLARCARLIAYYDAQPPVTDTQVEVLNLPEYSIYVNQQDGTEYAALNCMPTMLCMALKWRNPDVEVTPDMFRRKYPHITEGWYMYMVQEQLDAYDVPYTVAEPTRDNITDALDQGNIVLAQFSAWDLANTGHCFAIVGYRRLGGALWLCVEDPEGDVPGKYGRPANDQAWIEAEEVLWSITRFVGDITVVESAANEQATAITTRPAA